MAYRKKTLRSMSPTTRKVARLVGELSSIERRLKNLLPEIKEIEFQSQALKNAKQNKQPEVMKAGKPEPMEVSSRLIDFQESSKTLLKSTGIFKRNVFGELEEVPQEHIDAWCNLCQFPFIGGEQGCDEQSAIQQCWDEAGAIAEEWHKQHECPFLHMDKPEPCRCNDFQTIEEAYKAVGMEYGK